MGLRKVCFGLVFMIALGLSKAQWGNGGKSKHDQNPAVPRPLSQVPQQNETRIPQVPQRYDPSNPVFAPQSFPIQTPTRSDFGRPSQDLFGVQSKELMLGPVAKLTWRFPSLREEPQQPEIPFELRHPVPANSVAAQCGENSIYVEVMEDFFGTGRPLMPSTFTLGGCTATGEDPSAQVLIFESELHGCGSTSLVTEDELVYMFSLIYTPQEASYGGPIVRSSGAVVGIECHYPRVHNVSSDASMPTWTPYTSTVVSEELLVFSLRLMTDDWRFERPSYQYYLGDFINIEASVRSYNHVPLRVFVDSCVATSVPYTNAIPRYSFIENNGCLVDAKLTGSSSGFMPRTQIDKLQFQLEAFRFQKEISGFVYITCVLKVAAASTPTNVEQKACSFSTNRWVSADEDDQVCGCCDSTCGIGSGSDQLLKGDQSISLVNGLDACSGRVEILYNGTFGIVCGDSWDIDDAAVVCRQLGCGRAVIADGQTLFGVGGHRVSLSEVNCKGEESSITQCSQSNENNCPQRNDAGVICSASSVIIIGAVVTAVLLILSALIIIFLVRRRQKQKKIQICPRSNDAVNMQDVLHNQNEDNAEDDYEVVDMDDGDHEDVNSDSDKDYVNVDANDSEPDYINVETDDSDQDYVNVDITEHRSTLSNKYEEL